MMNDVNPYQIPQTEIVAESSFDLNLRELQRGQKLIIYAILAYFGTVFLLLIFVWAGLENVFGPLAGLLAIASIIMGLVGSVRLSRGLGNQKELTIFLVILMMVPFLGLIVLLILNSKATKRLRAGGYKVGFLGAKPL